MTRQQHIARLRGLGVSAEEVAAEFGITVRDVQRIDAKQREIRAIAARRRVAEPSFQAPKPICWRTARPLPERVRDGDYTCRAPEGCGERIHKGSYCARHHALFHVARAA